MTKVLPTQHKTNSQLINQYYFSIWRRFEDKGEITLLLT